MDPEERALQLDELEALKSVLRKDRILAKSDWKNNNENIQGVVKIDLEKINDPPIEIKGFVYGEGREFKYFSEFLPAIHLEFELPNDYPSASPPNFDVFSYWLTGKQRKLCVEAVKKVCEEYEGMTVLYFCCQAIIETVESWNLEFVNLNRAYEKEQRHFSVSGLRKLVFEEIEQISEDVFADTNFECQICFDSFLGRECYKFIPCEHVFCKNCIYQYYQSLAGGLISGTFKCLGDQCDTEASQKLVKEAVGEELFQKYDECLLQLALMTVGEKIECARPTCQMPTYVTDERMNLVECSYCGYNFCRICKETYHGVDPCKLKKEEIEEAIKKYQEADEEEQDELCKLYGGKEKFEVAMRNYLSEEWVMKNAKQCPKCHVQIEKSEGCNKVQCTNCGKYFCWICEQQILNGYEHFKSGFCNGKLFEGILDTDDELDENDM